MSIIDLSGDAISSTISAMPFPSEPNYFSAQVSDARRFYLELNPGTRGARRSLTVASGGWELCRSDYDIRRSGFATPIIEFVARGSGMLTLGDRQYELRPGAVFVYGPETRHQIKTSPERAMKKYFVAFEGGEELMRECQILPGAVRQAMHPEQLQQVFEDLIAHGLSDHANRTRMCQIALQYLMLKIADDALPHDAGETAAATATYQRCRQFIEENYLRVHTLGEVAVGCHVDRAYLCRLFKRFRRQTPFQYLQNLKMNRAVELLQNGGRSVKQAAQELGFGDPYNFSRTFKRIFGISPRHLLKRGE